MLGQIVTENGQKKIKALTADVGAGLPVGTWCSFENDVAPNANWIREGTTFDASAYPVLASYLGTNVVPHRYDHNRPSAYESFTFTANVDIIAPYDGLLQNSGSNEPEIYVNGDKVGEKYFTSGNTVYSTATIPVNKGDTIKITKTGGNWFAKWYKSPMFIKATSGLSENQQDSVINALNVSRSYSTEETLTGKTWIDGKPIYRKVFTGTTFTTSGDAWADTGYTAQNIDVITNGYALRQASGETGIIIMSIDFEVSTGKLIVQSHRSYAGIKQLVVEYTKTTD